MNHSPADIPRLLLVEDDPTSAAFLAAAAAALPALPVTATSLADAERVCLDQAFDLFLFDANLPDGRGEDLLRTLRERGIGTAALAHTADLDADMHARLLAAGFAEVLRKPLGMHAFHAALRRHLPDAAARPWDDAAALAALGGQHAHVQALRKLFLAELPQQRDRIVHAATHADISALRAELHKLSAGCGFVGAARLGIAVQALQAALTDRTALYALERAVDEILAARPAAPP
ncbi:response regulator [Thermomonas brevis]|uniref:Response regulator n=1 Tax=Thermomonas brevis TaxID=215691 RepID=A0A7G9QUS5_9GAMM|nr:response regulator [Thermomonas brevis]QNN47100.1 response regulator [Thermomonas brevis]